MAWEVFWETPPSGEKVWRVDDRKDQFDVINTVSLTFEEKGDMKIVSINATAETFFQRVRSYLLGSLKGFLAALCDRWEQHRQKQ